MSRRKFGEPRVVLRQGDKGLRRRRHSSAKGRARSVGAALGIAGVALAPQPPCWHEIASGDVRLLSAMASHRPLAWRKPAVLASEMAAPRVLIPAVAGVSAWAVCQGVPSRTVAAIVTHSAVGIAVRRAIADTVRRRRPPAEWWWSQPTGFSYPSRHTTWAALAVGVIFDLRRAGSATNSYLPLGLFTPAVAATRLILAVHWPSDVVAALAFSAAWRALSPRWPARPPKPEDCHDVAAR
jgi:membrane-associated phospholipid phosphatase